MRRWSLLPILPVALLPERNSCGGAVVLLKPAVIVFIPGENIITVPLSCTHRQCALRSDLYLFSCTRLAAWATRRASVVADTAC
jgi:hypothetical protein